jgi:hypothetical protein
MGCGSSTRIPLDVRSKNHPPYCKNKVKRVFLGDPVKATISRMISFPESIDILENCCRRLMGLAEGGKYALLANVLVLGAPPA